MFTIAVMLNFNHTLFYMNQHSEVCDLQNNSYQWLYYHIIIKLCIRHRTVQLMSWKAADTAMLLLRILTHFTCGNGLVQTNAMCKNKTPYMQC